jgi:hypothetical protein
MMLNRTPYTNLIAADGTCIRISEEVRATGDIAVLGKALGKRLDSDTCVYNPACESPHRVGSGLSRLPLNFNVATCYAASNGRIRLGVDLHCI